MLSPCNVYGVATIMYQFMERLRVMMLQPTITPEEDEITLEFSEMSKALYGMHENGLCDLVAQCLRSDPASRPNVHDLLETIDTVLYSEDHEEERLDGVVHEQGDTLLVPGETVRLIWASRLLGGVDNINAPRIALDSDEEMTDV